MKCIKVRVLHRQVFIDFDKLQTNDPALRVQRLSLLPLGRREAVGWYYRDDSLWREYGAQVRVGALSELFVRVVRL